MNIRFGISILFVATLLTLMPFDGLAQEQQPKPTSVYDASTVTPEIKKTKNLNLKEFSVYAGEMCKKYGLKGPTEIANSSDQSQLYSEMSAARKEMFKQLCDPKIREDVLSKEKIQAQMKSLTEDLSNFPKLSGFGHIETKPTWKEKIQSQINLPAPSQKTGLCDSLPAVREQIQSKHGEKLVK